MGKAVKLTGGTIYLVSFMTNSNKKIEKFVTIDDGLSLEQISETLMGQFSSIKEILYIDQWDDALILNSR